MNRLSLLLPVALGVALVPMVLPPVGASEVLRPPGWVRSPSSSPGALRPTQDGLLFAQLEEGDRRWLPIRQLLPNGSVRYVYRRRRGEPPLSAEQLEALLRNPPRYEKERRAIRGLLAQLRHLGVEVQLEPPQQAIASGEWRPRTATVRIRPDVPSAGSRVFARVLNHEAIHVAQSCRAGGLRRLPVLLGLGGQVGPEEAELLRHPVYRRAPQAVQRIEAEAFAHQNDLELGRSLLSRHCGAATGPPARLAP